jgi:hypothetical protein
MNTEFFNKYVDNLNAEIIELNKVRMMMKTQIDMLDEANKKMIERIKELEVSSLDKPELPKEKESKK